MKSVSDTGVELLERFEALISNLNQFTACLKSDVHSPLWVALTESEVSSRLSMRAKAVSVFQSLWYEDGQDGRETQTCPGLVGANLQTIGAAVELNSAKDRFKSAVLHLKSLSKTQSSQLLADLHQRNDEVARAMRRIGAPRLNLKQAYRHVPVLAQWPKKVGFTWSKQGRTIQRTTVVEARRLLERRADSPDKRTHLKRLDALPQSEMLARVRTTAPHLRANIVFDNPRDGVERRLVQAPLPILFPHADGESLPEFVPTPPEPGGQIRLKRSDVRIEDEPYLPLIRIHRYHHAFR